MSDQVVYVGPARSGKTSRLVRKYREALAGQPSRAAVAGALWLAPTTRAAAAVREALLAGGLRGAVGPGIATFGAIADRILVASASTLRPLAPPAERELLRRVIELAIEKSALTDLADAAGRPSFVDLLAEHFRELKRHGVRPADYAKSPGLRRDDRRHRELGQLYADYQQLLQRYELGDADDRLAAARDALATDTTGRFRQLSLLVVDGFTDFTRLQLDVMGLLARRAERTLVSLPGDAELADRDVSAHAGRPPTASPVAILRRKDQPPARHDLFAKTNRTLADLRQLFSRPTVEYLPERPSDWPALDHVARHLFRNPRHVPPLPAEARASASRIEVVAAASRQDEVVQIARRIKQQLVTGAARPGDILVIYRSLSEAPRVREIFAEFGIPFSAEAGLPLASTAILRTLLALLRLDAEDWPFRRLVSVLTNNSIAFLADETRATAERLVRDLQIAAGRDALLRSFGQLAKRSEEDLSDEPGQERSRRRQAASALAALEHLAAALDALPREATYADWHAALEQLAHKFGIRQAPADAPIAAIAPTALEDGIHLHPSDEAAWEQIAAQLAALDRLDNSLAGTPPRRLSRPQAIGLLTDLAEHERLPRLHDEVGRVRVLSAVTARTVSAPHVYLAGMSEQAFPSPERAGRLYSEEEYRHFENVADQELAASARPAANRAHDEMLLFYEVLTRATESLTISYPALDDKAQSLPASPYVGEVERLLGPEAFCRAAPQLSPVPAIAEPQSPADWRRAAVSRALSGDSAWLAGMFRHPPTSAAAAALDAGLRWVDARGGRDSFGPAEGLLASPAAAGRLARRFGEQHAWSPSQWEKYAGCPYRFFLEEVLGLEPLGELTLATDYSRRGSLFHRVLAEFHREIRATLEARSLSQHDRETILARFTATLDGIVRRAAPAGVDAALLELDRRQIARWGERYLDHHTTYDQASAHFDEPLLPSHFEVRFGPPRHAEEDEDPRSTDQTYRLDIGGETIEITGRIDRIDVGRVAGQVVFNVIDYKSGKKVALRPERIATGQQLQLPIYLVAAQSLLLASEGAVPFAAGYWSAASGFDGKSALAVSQVGDAGVVPHESWPDTWQSAVDRVGEVVRAIRHGDFPVYSLEDDCTSRCQFNTICRVASVRSLEKCWPPTEK